MLTVVTKQNLVQDKANPGGNLDLAALFQEYYPRIYNYLRYRVRSIEDAEDLISVVFERAYTRRDQFDANKGSFSAWLFQIAHNTLVNHYRKRKRESVWEAGVEPPPDLTTSDPTPEAQLIHQEAIVELLSGLGQLSERDQEIISLKFAGKLKNREIGAIVGMSEKAVSVALVRAMRRLRQQVKEDLEQ